MCDFIESTSETNLVIRDISAPFTYIVYDILDIIEEIKVKIELELEPQLNDAIVEKKENVFGVLPLESDIIETEYYGPIPESNIVIPGKLIVGAYPGDDNNVLNTHNLIKILNCNVTTFVCLQKEYDPNIPDFRWRCKLGLRPYFKDVENLIKIKSEYKELKTDITSVSFIHKPIADCCIIDDTETINLARKLVQLICNGEVLYIHCWGGHGRTGVIVCLMLHLMYNLTADEAMRRCQIVHDMRRDKVIVSSPQTATQKEQVRRIIQKLQENEKL